MLSLNFALFKRMHLNTKLCKDLLSLQFTCCIQRQIQGKLGTCWIKEKPVESCPWGFDKSFTYTMEASNLWTSGSSTLSQKQYFLPHWIACPINILTTEYTLGRSSNNSTCQIGRAKENCKETGKPTLQFIVTSFLVPAQCAGGSCHTYVTVYPTWIRWGMRVSLSNIN